MAAVAAGVIAAVACGRGPLVVFDPAMHCDRLTRCAAKLSQAKGIDYQTQATDREQCVTHASAIRGQGAVILSAYFTDCSPADDDCQYSICMMQHTGARSRAKDILYGTHGDDGE